MDSIYIERILNGDTSAFAYLVDKYKNMAFSVALGVVKNVKTLRRFLKIRS